MRRRCAAAGRSGHADPAAFRLEGGGATLPGGMELAGGRAGAAPGAAAAGPAGVEMPGRHRLRLGAVDLPFAADRLAATLPLEAGCCRGRRGWPPSCGSAPPPARSRCATPRSRSRPG